MSLRNRFHNDRPLKLFGIHKEVSAIFVCTVILSLILFLTPPALGAEPAADNDLFTIDSVAVDITAENAVEARQQAITAAQKKAFDQLKQQLLARRDREAIDALTTERLKQLVRDFTVDNESTAPRQYRALFTVRFDPGAVKSLFDQEQLSYTTVRSDPVMVLPFLQIGERFLLWDDPNPWRDLWFSEKDSPAGLVPHQVPVGDIEDLKDTPDNLLTMANASENIKRLKDRYNVDRIYAVAVKSKGPPLKPDEGTITRVFQFFDGLPVEITRIDSGGGFETAMNAVKAFLEDSWKTRAETKSGTGGYIQARAFFSSLEAWINLKRQIENITPINRIELREMTQSYANLILYHNGALETLFPSMEGRGLFLSRTPILDGQFHILKPL